MADVRALVIKSGTQQQIPSADSLLVGSGVDASAPGPLSIGASAADEITIGKIGVTTTFPGDVDIQGNVNTVGGTTFTDDVTFQGNTTFGDNLAPDSVTFSANTTVDLGANKITNVADPTAGSQDAATAKYVDDGLDLKVDIAGDTMTGSLTMSSGATVTGLPAASAESDAVSKSYAEDYFLGGEGSNTLIVQEGGQFASLQAAIDAAASGDIIFVGPKAAGWGSISLTAIKNLTIVGFAQAATEQKLCRVTTVEMNIASGLNPNDCEVNIVGLFIGATVASGALVRFTGAGSARLRMRHCSIFKSGAGDSVESSNTGSGSSFYLDNCLVNSQDTAGTTLKHVSGYTLVQNRTSLDDGAIVVSCAAGSLVITDCTLTANAASAGPAVSVTGGTVSMGTSAIIFPKASGVGVSVASGAVFGASQTSILVGTGLALATGKAITGAGTAIIGEVTYGLALVYSNVVDATTVAPAIRSGGALNSALSMSPNGGTTKLKITDLADGTDANDAVNKSQLDALVVGVSDVTATAPLASSGGATPDISLTGVIDVANGGTGASTLTGYVSGNGASAFTASATIPGSDISGDISGNAANVNGTVAIANGGTGQTTAAAAFGALSPLTTKGDVLGYSTDNARIPVGTDGQVITADSAEALGVKWSTPTVGTVTDVTASAPLASSGGATPDISLTGVIDVANGGTGVATITAGSLVVGDGANAIDEIAPGANGEVLTVVAGAWTSQAIPAAVDYSVVSITTAVSQGDAVIVDGTAAIATADASARVAGMVSATANKVSVLGIIEDCNFEGSLTLAVGEAVYLSASSAGKLTNVAPSASGEVVAELGIIVTVNAAGGGAAAADVLWQPKSIVVL
jgi:hypothetical protein